MPNNNTLGASQSPWEADEAILATSLNARERTYGALPVVDEIGVSDLPPTVTIAIDDTLYGVPLYGSILYTEG